jgi:hypothetical protein
MEGPALRCGGGDINERLRSANGGGAERSEGADRGRNMFKLGVIGFLRGGGGGWWCGGAISSTTSSQRGQVAGEGG